MELNKQIIKALSQVSGVPEAEIKLDIPENTIFGDYSSNIALVQYRLFAESVDSHVPGGKKDSINWAKEPSKIYSSPRELGEGFITKLKQDNELFKIIDKIEVAGPGFINFFLKKDVLLDTLVSISSQKYTDRYSQTVKRKRIMFEYGDANTHKLPHIGHLFSYTYGESVCRILAYAGYDVRKVCYQGDVGTHVAKCLWAYKKESPDIPKKLEDKVMLLQRLYQAGSKAFDEDVKAKTEIIEVNKAIYAKDPEIDKLWQETRKWSVDYYKQFEEKLGVSYDRYYYESEVYKKGKEIVESEEGKIFKRSDGALIFEGNLYGLHDRVFVTKFGTPTYEAKDMYLQKLKFEEWWMDKCIITTANEQNGYFDVIFKALETLDSKYSGKLLHIGFGMINLKSGKMSSRTGEIAGAVDVVEHVMGEVEKQNQDSEISEAVAIGAIKYSFLKNNYLQNMTFDINESISKEGNSGPYLQYTFARTQSVIRKAGMKNNKSQMPTVNENLTLNEEELVILRVLVHFPEVVIEAAEKYAPNLICNYLYDLAQKYNTFYARHKILGINDKNVELVRLEITKATGIILKEGLNLLGIKAPEKM